MKRILWLSNVRFSVKDLKGTGTWLQPLATSLTLYYEIYHICCGVVKSVAFEEVAGIKQYVIPNRETLHNTQIPDKITCNDVRVIVDKINPDLIHVWGTESRWAYMKVLGVFGIHKTLLDMQGYLWSCYESFYAGLTTCERFHCIGLKEILRPSSSIFANRRIFKKKAVVETKILNAYENISYQSEWVRNRLNSLHLKASLYETKIIVRSDFFNQKWGKTNNSSPVIFTSTAVAHSYKGLHVLIKACSILKNKYPSFVLYVAGRVMVKSHNLLSGYESYLASLIKKFDLSKNVKFLGSLSADEMIRYQLKSDVCVVPSMVESYCIGLAESLTLGLPAVVAYSAAMPTIARDKEEVLFYSPLDYVDCAEKIIGIFKDKSIAQKLSDNSIKRRIADNSKDFVVSTQLKNYKSILEN